MKRLTNHILTNRLPIFGLLLMAVGPITMMAQTYQERATSVSNVGLTISNIGVFGNAFKGNYNLTGQPSAEYPRNSGIECMFQGGLWVGARVNGGDLRVSSGYFDAPDGYNPGTPNFEFTVNPGNPLVESSSLVNSPNFDPRAVSHQDFRSTFTDQNILVPGTSIPIQNHNPMGLEVDMETYNWSFEFANFFVVAKFSIRNTGSNILDSVYVGYLTNGVIRNTNITPARSGGTAYYDKGGNAFIDSLQLAYDFDATGNVGFTNVYYGQKFLGGEDKTGFRHPELDTNFKCNFQCWGFQSFGSLFFTAPTTELDRYSRMSTGLNHQDCWTQPLCNGETFQQTLNRAGNRSNMVSVGPYATMNPGDTITFYYTFVFGPMLKDPAGPANTNDNRPSERVKFLENVNWVETAFYGNDRNRNGVVDPDEDDGSGQINRFILPAPPDIPYTKVVAGDNRIEIYWSDNSLFSIDPISKVQDFEGFRIYKTQVGFDMANLVDVAASLKLLAEYDVPGNRLFFDNGFDQIKLPQPVYFEGDSIVYHYRYVIDNIQNGWQHVVAVTAFDRGDPETNVESLESSRLSNLFRVFPGKPVNSNLLSNQPFVYPNPYYGGSAWEGRSVVAEDKKLIFANLPKRCVVRIFTSSGNLVDEFEHNEGYNGTGTRWFETYSEPERTIFSGGEHAWDILSADNQIISRGLYYFTVEDSESNQVGKGKFVIIK